MSISFKRNVYQNLINNIYLKWPIEKAGVLCGHKLNQNPHDILIVDYRDIFSQFANNNKILINSHIIKNKNICPHGTSVLGIYHTHPSGTSRPSKSDIKSSLKLNKIDCIISNNNNKKMICHKGDKIIDIKIK